MRKFLLAFLSFLPGIAFAQFGRTQDIGELLFRDILRMTEYPGAPFTGNIINDLVMMLFIPSVFIIIVIYTLVGRLTPHPKLNLLMSLAFYAFIVFGGYFRIFALLAGPYFLFLLIIMGLLFFFLGHFGLRRGGPMPAGGAGGGGGMAGSAVGAGPDQFVSDMIRVRSLTTSVNAGCRPNADTRNLGDHAAQLTEMTERLKVELQGWGGAAKFKKLNPIQSTIEGHKHLNPDQIIRDAENAIRRAENYVR